MQDYNYLYGNCLEITFELSCCKYPPATELHKEWDLNKESLLDYMEQVGRLSKTKVIMMITNPPNETSATVKMSMVYSLKYYSHSGPYRCSRLCEGCRHWSSSQQCQHHGGGHSPQPDHWKIWRVLPPATSRNIQHHSSSSRVNNTSEFTLTVCKVIT